MFWTQAFAGVTTQETFYETIKIESFIDLLGKFSYSLKALLLRAVGKIFRSPRSSTQPGSKAARLFSLWETKSGEFLPRDSLMCLDFYGFREKPFNLTPDPRFVFLSKPHQGAFAHLLHGINNRTGFIAFTEEVGSGKTTALRALPNQLDPIHYRTALIFNPSQSPRRLLQNINREFGIPRLPAGQE
jgi:type II secretory pathway predicted ATPase ExeA